MRRRAILLLSTAMTAALVAVLLIPGLASAQEPPPGATLDASYWNKYPAYGFGVGGKMRSEQAQTFTAVYSGEVRDVEVAFGYEEPHNAPITVQLTSLDSSGAPGTVLASTTIAGSTLPPWTWDSEESRVTAHFDSPARIKAGKRYGLVLSVPEEAASDSAWSYWGANGDTNPYTGGKNCYRSTFTGGAWECSVAAGQDKLFTIFVQLDPGVNAAPRVANVQEETVWSTPGVVRRLTATFSEVVDAETVTGETVKLSYWDSSKKSWQLVTDAVVNCDSPCRTVTLETGEQVDEETNAKFQVTTGVKDLSGKRLDQKPSARGRQGMSWIFTASPV